MPQFTKAIDVKLNGLSREIGAAVKDIEEATQRKDQSWNDVIVYFDEVGQNDFSPRFIAEDGHYLQLQAREGKPSLDEDMLQALIYQRFPKAEASKIWNSITKRVLDNTALEAAVRTGKVPEELVSECMTPAKVSYARIRNKWTKEDRERARILGITETK